NVDDSVPARPRCVVTAESAASTAVVLGRPTTSESRILPACSRSRSPSARNMKSNLPRSAVRAMCSKDAKSIWLPDRGSLHTVVLLTPGKCAASLICLAMSHPRVLVDGPAEPEMVAQRLAGVRLPERPGHAQRRDDLTGEQIQIVRQHGRPDVEPGGTGPVRPLLEVGSESCGCADEVQTVR